MTGLDAFAVVVTGVIALGSLGVGAQSRAAAPPKPKAASMTAIKNGVTIQGAHVTLVVGTSAETAVPGGSATLLIQVSPGPKIHLYAPGQQGYLPVSLSVATNSAFRVRPIVYPPATPYAFSPTAETVKVYSAPFLIREDMVLASTPDLKRRAGSGETLAVGGTFAYQACDDAVCYRPETVAVAWKVPLAPAAR